MTLTASKKVVCARCGTEHDAVPPERGGFDGDNLPITAVFAVDYTYIQDFYLNKGYSVLCKSHTRDDIAHKKDSEIDSEYSNRYAG